MALCAHWPQVRNSKHKQIQLWAKSAPHTHNILFDTNSWKFSLFLAVLVTQSILYCHSAPSFCTTWILHSKTCYPFIGITLYSFLCLQEILESSFSHVSRYFKDLLSFPPDPTLENTGTTATVCLLRNGNELVTANVGDSRAMICRQGKAMRLMRDHEPEYNAQEKARIKRCGGYIRYAYVN